MKALTVKQPWADLIVSGVKDIENRTWQTNYRGRILIHASKNPTPKWQLYNYELPIILNHIQSNYPFGHIVGAIVGMVDIVDCVKQHPSEWAEDSDDVWNWVIANPIKFTNPIMGVKGALSLWEYNGSIPL